MPGLVQIPLGYALLYFEIVLPKMLHMDVRNTLKTKAYALLGTLVNEKIRNEWSSGELKYPYPARPVPFINGIRQLTWDHNGRENCGFIMGGRLIGGS